MSDNYIKEDLAAGNPYRKDYITSIEALIRRKRAEADDRRASRAAAILADPQNARAELAEMLGWPLVGEKPTLPNVTSTYVGVTEYGAETYRMQFEIFPGFLYYGILFLHKDEVCPLSLSQHGGLGTPELCSGLHGSSGNYNDITKRIYTHGFHVFAPQMLIWNLKAYPVTGERSYPDIDTMRRTIDKELKQLGGSITALELYCLFRTLDYFETQTYVRDKEFAMAGLSYGGFYTEFAAALEPRIRSAVSCSFFNDRYRYGWVDWTWKNSANLFCDAELALLTYPRNITYQIGTNDELFDCESGKAEYDRAVRLAPPDFGDHVKLEVFSGNHEFSKDDTAIMRLAADFGL